MKQAQVQHISKEEYLDLLKNKRSKYNVDVTTKGKLNRTADGYVFASQEEMIQYLELKKLEKAHKISDVSLQPSFVLQEAFVDSSGRKHREVRYVADFFYCDCEHNHVLVVADRKGKK